MNAFQELFQRKQQGVLSVYFTAGYPRLESTGKIIRSLVHHGVDMIEVGIPYSDPLADGPVIQHSSMMAIRNGISIKKIFEQLNEVQAGAVPLVLMGYLNPVLQYGFERFCRDAAAAGVSGLILPDLPVELYETEYQRVVEAAGLSFIFLVTPETSEERIRKMDALSTGFIYAVSSSSITGSATNFDAQQTYFKRLRDLQLQNPVLAGFGIRDARTFAEAGRYTAGAIIGTAFIQALEKGTGEEVVVENFINSILDPSETKKSNFVE